MKLPSTPATCTFALACMVAAGASHWWSVRQLTSLLNGPDITARNLAEGAGRDAMPTDETTAAPPSGQAATNQLDPPAPAQAMPQPLPAEPLAMQQFYQELIREMQHLRTENRDLLNQVAETNRDLMKLEFRVDTHSEQFRPLPVAEDKFGTTFDTGFDDGPGLLPPRAEPVALPLIE